MQKLAQPTEQEVNEGPQTVSFQIANGNARQHCILQTRLPTKVQAQKYLLTNWPIIEKMARDALATGTFEGDQIEATRQSVNASYVAVPVEQPCIAQNVAPMLNKFRPAVKRLV